MKSMFRLLSYAKPYKTSMIMNVLSNIFMVLFSLVSLPLIIPFLKILFNTPSADVSISSDAPLKVGGSFLENINAEMAQLIEQLGREQALLIVCVLMAALYFLKNLFRYLALVFMAPVRNGIIRDLRSHLFNKMLMLPLGYFSNERKGDLMSRMAYDVQEVEWSILNVLEMAVREPLLIIGSILLMFLISVKLTLFVLVLIAFTVFVIGNVGHNLKKNSTKAQEKLGVIMSHIDEALSGMRIIKAFGAQDYQQRTFDKENSDYRHLSIRLLWRRDLASPLSEFMGATIIMVLLYFGGHWVFSGEVPAETLLGFLAIFANIINPAKNFSQAFSSIRKGLGAMERIETILNNTTEVYDAPKALPVKGFNTSLELRNVSFAYREGEPVLKDISLSIPKGKVIALVGLSGSGKTTLADLIPRFYDISEGEILLDGVETRQLKLGELRQLFGIVSQEPTLFNDTVANNIAFGLNATAEQIEAAARVAHAHDFIVENPEGYNFNIGDRGCKLSGGQRQRLTIARAVLKNPDILILDEATSSLDSESERLVQDALAKLLSNRTALVIAHRLSTIQHADEIIVLQDGCVAERGTHDTLMAQSGIYKQLVDLQEL